MMRSQSTFSITAIALIFPLAFISCADNADNDNNNNTNQQPHAYTEQDFVSDPNLAAHPDRKVVVVHLEPETADESSNLTGEIGFDVIPFNYTDATNQTLCWEDPDADAAHVMKLLDSEGQELVSIGANEGCVTVTLVPGRYEMHLIHDNKSDGPITLFIQPNVPSDQIASSRTSENANLNKLISTNKCIGCDLRYTLIDDVTTLQNCTADNVGEPAWETMDLSQSDMTGATLKQFLCCSGSFYEVILTDATIISGNYIGTIFSASDLSNSTLTSVDFNDVDFTGATFENASISDTSFFQAQFFPDQFHDNNPTIFNGATITNSNFQESFGLKLAVFWNTTLKDCDLTGLDLTENFLFNQTDLTGSNLTSTNLSNTIMADVIFDDVILEQANLSGFVCTDCSFTGANFEGANVQGINIDATGAIWTDGACVCQDTSCSNC